jgi:hypothetical protein
MSFDRFLSLCLLVASTAVVVLAFVLEPDPRGLGTHEQLGLPPCGFLRDHGVPCISCGMTTAFVAMAHGQPLFALRANPFGTLLFLLAVLAPLHFAHSLVTGLDPLRGLRHPRAAFVLPIGAALLLANWGLMVHLARGNAPG